MLDVYVKQQWGQWATLSNSSAQLAQRGWMNEHHFGMKLGIATAGISWGWGKLSKKLWGWHRVGNKI